MGGVRTEGKFYILQKAKSVRDREKGRAATQG